MIARAYATSIQPIARSWVLSQWRTVLVVSYALVNIVFIRTKLALGPGVAVDWALFEALPAAVASGTVYDIRPSDVAFVYSPVAAWLLAQVAGFGYWPWVAVHVGAVFLLRDWRMSALVLVSYGFWFDTAQGNTVSLCLIAGLLAVRGGLAARLIYLGLLLLMPRPLMLPLAAWLLFTDATIRIPFAVMFVVHGLLVVMSGMAMDWMSTVITYDLAPGITIGPTAWWGRWWLLVGVPLAALLAWRRWFGWAGLALSPYITPQYVLWPLLDLRRPGAPADRPMGKHSPERARQLLRYRRQSPPNPDHAA